MGKGEPKLCSLSGDQREARQSERASQQAEEREGTRVNSPSSSSPVVRKANRGREGGAPQAASKPAGEDAI